MRKKIRSSWKHEEDRDYAHKLFAVLCFAFFLLLLVLAVQANETSENN